MPRMGGDSFVRIRTPGGAGGYIMAPVLTTTQRDALSAEEGMLIFNSTTDQLEEYDGSTWEAAGQVALDTHAADKDAHHSNVVDLEFLIDGAGSAIATGEKGHLKVDFACTITGAWLLAAESGSIKIDIWKDTYANFPPTNTDSICGGNEPEISSAQKDEDTTLTSWTTAISAGDILAFNVDSCTTITRVTVILRVTKT